MTCFWDSLRKGLNLRVGNGRLIECLKLKNTKTHDVLWNNKKMRKQQMMENFDHVYNFDPRKIGNGYDCSICDPFLVLICEIFEVDVEHNYNGNVMRYSKKNNDKVLLFTSDTGHFTFKFSKCK